MVTNPFDSEERGLIQRTIEKGYREFKGRVAEGRNRDTVYIESVAQGRVFTGNQALANGLVDELGTLDDAISYAAKKANLKKYSIKEFPQEKEFAEKISEAFGEAKLNWIKSELGEQYEIYKVMQTLKKSSGIQMRMPYSFGIE
jgi:protease-4